MGLLYRLVIFAGLAVGFSDGQARMEIYPEGDKAKLKEGESLFLTCLVKGVAAQYNPNLKWRDHQGFEITRTTGDIYIDRGADLKKLNLIINGVRDYSGTYTCEGVVGGQPVQQTKEVVYERPIKFENAPTPQHPVINTDALIICEVTGTPSPDVAWIYKGIKLSTGGRYKYTTKGLKISKITQNDNGEYTCRATVPLSGSMKEQKIQVDVYIPPVITQKPPEQTVGTEDRYETQFSCRASGHPAPLWEFYKDNSDAPLSSTDTMQVDGKGGNIYFKPLKKRDEGTYRCKAYNDAGSDEVQGFLKVHVMPGFVEMWNKTQPEGKEEVLECKVRADPPAFMTFTKVGTNKAFVEGPQPEDERIIIEKQNNILRLRIKNLRPQDSSNYTCRAENSAGWNHWNGTITVHFKPRFDNTPMNELYNWAGRTRNLTCIALSMPYPDWEWWHNGHKVNANDTFKIFYVGLRSDLAVSVRDIEEHFIYGNYHCNATNKMGSTSHIINMKRALVPHSPESIQVIKDTDTPTVVPIRVKKPLANGGVAVIGYRLEYEDKTIDTGVVDTIIVEDLKPSFKYFFRVRARNAVGFGSAAELTHNTKSVRRPYRITIVSETESPSPYEYVAKWERPLTGGMAIRYYIFQYRKMQKNQNRPAEDWTKKEVEDDETKPMQSYTIKNLNANTRYQLIIMARNEMGKSDPQEQDFFFFTAEDPNSIPKPPEASVDPTAEPGDTGASVQTAGFSTAAIIGIVIAAIFIFIIIIDMSCYFMNDCGLLMCICVHLCGKQKQGQEKVIEEGEGEMLKVTTQREDAKKEDHHHDDEQDEKHPLNDKDDSAEDVKKPPEDSVIVVDPSDVDVTVKKPKPTAV